MTGRPSKAMYLAEFKIDGFDVADVAIIDLFVIVILDLHDLVADGKARPEFLDLWVSSRIESPLQLDIQRTGSARRGSSGRAPECRAWDRSRNGGGYVP